MAIRYDRGSTIATLKPHITEDGMLLAEAVFARDGVLEYRDALTGKVRRELRPPEENQKALTDFGILSITDEHPSGLLTEDNAANYRKGLTLQNVEHVTTRKGGFVKGSIVVFDSALKNLILSGEKVETSTGYRCDVEEKAGVWVAPDGSQHRYDAIQRNVKTNHQAVTIAGRAGADVRVHTDSDDPDVAYQVDAIDPQPFVQDSTVKPKEQRKRMATIRIDSVEYELPETVAPVIGAKIARLDKAEIELEKNGEKLAEAIEEQTRASARADAATDRAESAEYVLGNAEEILEGLGYTRDSQGVYHKEDSASTVKADKKAKPPADDEEDEADGGDDEEAEEDKPMPPWMAKVKGKGKGKKDMKKDSTRVDAKTLLAAWKEADKLVPANEEGVSFMDQHFDSVESDEHGLTHIKALVVQSLKPKLKLDSMGSDKVEALYDLIKSDAEDAAEQGDDDREKESRADSLPSYTQGLRNAVTAARANAGDRNSRSQRDRQELEQPAYEQPLSLSRSN